MDSSNSPHPFENLPLPVPAAEEFLVYAVVEQETGELERTVWNEQERRFVRTGMMMKEPLPVPYGWLPGTLCEGDGDALDVLIMTRRYLRQGEFLAVRPIGVMLRADNDHKVLAVDPLDPEFNPVSSYRLLDPALIVLIENWFRRFFALDGWLDAPAACQMILQSTPPNRQNEQ